MLAARLVGMNLFSTNLRIVHLCGRSALPRALRMRQMGNLVPQPDEYVFESPHRKALGTTPVNAATECSVHLDA